MKKVTTTDIAKLAGVSQTTVSLILSGKSGVSISDETRNRVYDSAKKLGYTKKSSHTDPFNTSSQLIGLMVSNLTNPYFTVMASCVESLAHENSFNTIICNTERKPEKEKSYIEDLINRGVDGIIMAFTPSNYEYINKVSESIPIVIIGETDSCANLQTIGLNSIRAGEMVAEHLYELGHRKIAFLTSPVKNVSLSRQRRMEGMHNYLMSKGITDTFYILESENEIETDDIYEVEIGYDLTRKLLSKCDVTAVVAVSDLMVLGIYSVLSEAGLSVPNDVSVVGFDNNFLSRTLCPKLTTIEHHIKERSKLAVEQLLKRIKNKSDLIVFSYSVEYRPSLIIRESTASVKK